MRSSLSSSHSLSTPTIHSHFVSVEGTRHSRCFVISELRDNFRLTHCLKLTSIKISTFSGYNCCRGHSRFSDGASFSEVSPSSPHTFGSAACCAKPANHNVTHLNSDSHGDLEPDPDPGSSPPQDPASITEQIQTLKDAVSPVLSDSSKSSEPESWMLIHGEDDVPTVVSSLPMTERYAPRRLVEIIAKKVDIKMFSPAQLKRALMFWKENEKLEEDPSFAASAFGEKGVSQIYQWTATDLTMQHARLTRIARDILYLVTACSLLGFVRVLEALSATFSSRPPHYSKLLEAANSLDFFTMAFLAYSLRKPVVGILRVDPTNLDEVVQLKAKIWDEMHKFYERQWKLVATLAVGRLLALVAQKLPSTNVLTRNMKMCWDFLLALPIF
ncbi:hypothetical protein L7F22_043122 [Adiantum nelumboides]|nr:hypothetical protein [Adiantum nelumboides]